MTFEEEYFDKAYRGSYEKSSPFRKLRYYLTKIKEVKQEGDLLDVGCAYGSFLYHAQQYYSITGIDISHNAIDKAKKRLPDKNLFISDILALKTAHKFDIVTCFDVLEHVHHLDLALERISDLLNNDGILAVTVPVYDTLAGKIVTILDKDKTHLWKESRDFWRMKLQEHGYKIIMDEGLWRYNMFNLYYAFWGGKIWRNFSPAILLIGAKDDIYRSAGL